MDKFCEDCVHNSVCHYGAYCPSGHCNDKDTLDDLRPQGEWKPNSFQFECNLCENLNAYKSNFCPNCGAKMQKGDTE